MLNHIVEMNQKKVKLFYKMWMDICVHCNVFETFCMQKLVPGSLQSFIIWLDTLIVNIEMKLHV